MGGSSSKSTFFWQKKKRSPVEKAWRDLRRALPNNKRKKRKKKMKSLLSLDKLKKRRPSQKRFSLSTDKKEPISLKRLSLGNARKESLQSASPGRKEKDGGGGGGGGGGLESLGEQIKRKFSQGSKKEQEVFPPPVNLNDTREEKGAKKKLSELVRPFRPS